jgi:hypothetical protein
MDAGIVEHMFGELDDAALVSAMADAARTENMQCARRIALIGELYERRQIPVEDGHGRELWRIDPWDSVAAEIGAAIRITSAAASALIHDAICLRDRLPKVAAVFASGAITLATIRLIAARTLLALEPEVLDAIDTDVAEFLTNSGPLSRNRTEQAIDEIITRRDPEAPRRTERAARARYVDIQTHPDGTATVAGELYATDATQLERRLSELAHTVCDADPRTMDQRVADALGALAAGHTALQCACGDDTCPAGDRPTLSPSLVVHVVAEAAALTAAADSAHQLHGIEPDDDGREIITSSERLTEIVTEARRPAPKTPPSTTPSPTPGVVLGGSVVPTALLADLVGRGLAKVRPVVHPGESPPEDRYHPSGALADFVRCRDMTCRFPNCDRPADRCEIDHTIPHGCGGPTHASNLKCLCVFHHLLKTFWTGVGGWFDKQYPDGTVEWTSPTGHTYRTDPGSKLLVPALCVPTGTLTVTARRDDNPHRGTNMPKRSETRAANRLRRILAERARNTTS